MLESSRTGEGTHVGHGEVETRGQETRLDQSTLLHGVDALVDDHVGVASHKWTSRNLPVVDDLLAVQHHHAAVRITQPFGNLLDVRNIHIDIFLFVISVLHSLPPVPTG